MDGWTEKHFFILDRSVGKLLAGKQVARDGVKKNWVTKSAQSVVDTVENNVKYERILIEKILLYFGYST